jgi:hypothetical protein
MNRLVAKTVDEAVRALTQFKGWKPFRYSGNVFYLVQEGECYRIYRTKKSAVDYAIKMSKECVRVDYKSE